VIAGYKYELNGFGLEGQKEDSPHTTVDFFLHTIVYSLEILPRLYKFRPVSIEIRMNGVFVIRSGVADYLH
jgi:hypothetical protein